jgi:RNA polymerase sigma-70 factor (ECF subfamily)
VDATERRRGFQDLVATSSSGMLRVSARILGDVGDAEDAVQEAFSRVWRAMESGELAQMAHAKTYLYRAVTNAAIDGLRRRKRRAIWTRLFGEDEPEPEGHEAPADVLVALGELRVLLEDLPDEQRAALVLKDVEGWSSAEIAEARGCSEGAVEQRLVRARATLRARLDGEGTP